VSGPGAARVALEVVLLTAPDAEVGGRLARALVGEGLAACVNVVPGVRSIYRWQGELHDDAEVLLVAKTRADRAEAFDARVRELHPYELPELLRLPVAGGSAAYLDWVRGECAP
jgi:periplasmic divalent cation tolerance protein